MRLYRLLLRLYPKAFRVEYGEEMCAVFAERQKGGGALAWWGLWVETVPDVFVNAARAQADCLAQDLRSGLRGFARAPGFAATAVVVTALGIGATAAVFSVADRVLIRPLPFADAGRLVKLWERVPSYSRMELSPLNYLDWKRMSTSFEGMAAYHFLTVNLVGRGDPVNLDAVAVTGELFDLLGVSAFIGRTLDEADAREGAADAAVLSYPLWQRQFGGQRDALGTVLRLDDRSYVVVGVMPETFLFPRRDTDLWIARRFTSDDLQYRDDNHLHVLAKLVPGVGLRQARAELEAVTAKLELAYPEENENTRGTVSSLRDEVPEQSRRLLAALIGGTICLLLIACTNLASLFVVRGMARRQELVLRGVLGAGRERLVRQLLTESLLLALVGGALGLLVAELGLPLLGRLVPTNLPMAEPSIDLRVLAVASLLSLGAGLAFGVLPALQAGGRIEPGVRGGFGARRHRFRAAIVVVQLSATVLLLVGSGLTTRALLSVRAVDPGFRTADVLAVRTPLPLPRYERTARRAELYARVLSEVRALPGVAGAAFASFVPMAMKGGVWPVVVETRQERDEGSERASLRFVTPGFFSTLGISLLSGRDFRSSDSAEGPDVAVVSESFARRYWPSEGPLGKRFQIAFRDRVVVGVVADVRVRGLERPSEPQVYLPHQQVPDGGLVFYAPKELVLRSERAEQHVAAVRRILRAADPELPVAEVRTLEEVVDAETAPRSTQLRALAAFTSFSLLLSGVGLYGLLSFGVSERRGEIGLRMALGARARDIYRSVLGEGARLAGCGSALGLAFALVAARSLEALLVGVEPWDALTFLGSMAVVLFVGLLGSFLPARRAARVDPATSFRAD